eukprot:21587_1
MGSEASQIVNSICRTDEDANVEKELKQTKHSNTKQAEKRRKNDKFKRNKTDDINTYEQHKMVANNNLDGFLVHDIGSNWSELGYVEQQMYNANNNISTATNCEIQLDNCLKRLQNVSTCETILTTPNCANLTNCELILDNINQSSCWSNVTQCEQNLHNVNTAAGSVTGLEIKIDNMTERCGNLTQCENAFNRLNKSCCDNWRQRNK